MDILIVDDEPVAIALLKRLIARISGCRPVPFTHPAKSLDWCADNDPDMLIVDYMMPDLNGMELVSRFRMLPGKAETPVLMVTATDDRKLRQQALTMGINDFLTKPLDAVELQARVRNMLALRSSQKSLAQRALMLAEEVARSENARRDVISRERETLLCLGRAAEHRDPETHEHIIRMSNYSKLIAQRMNLSDHECELLLLAAPLHDIGKLGTPDSILLKPGKLTPEEFEIMKQHTVIGANILSHSASPILRSGAQIALSHHEKFDGSGYPYGVKGKDIPLFGRIVAVADVFDALTSVRPYKTGWSVDRAVAFLAERKGNHFDPDCVMAFFSAMDEVLRIKAQHQEAEADPRDIPADPPSSAEFPAMPSEAPQTAEQADHRIVKLERRGPHRATNVMRLWPSAAVPESAKTDAPPAPQPIPEGRKVVNGHLGDDQWQEF